MGQKKKNPQFRDHIDKNEINDYNSPKNEVNNKTPFFNSNNQKISKQRQKAKFELMKKYNMSDSEAEEVLQKIEQDVFIKKQNKKGNKKQSNKSKSNFNSNAKNISSKANANFNNVQEKEEFLSNTREEHTNSKIRKQKSNHKNSDKLYNDESRLKKFLNNDDEDVIIPVHSNNKISDEIIVSDESNRFNNKKESMNYSKSDIDLDDYALFNKDKKNKSDNFNKNSDIFSDFSIGDEEEFISSLTIFSPIYSSAKFNDSSFDINKYIKDSHQKDSFSDGFFSDENNYNYYDNETSFEKRNGENIHDVDSIISDISPSLNRTLCIELENVSLSFETGNDRIDNLKEYFIRTLKHNKEKKDRFQALKDINFKIYKGEKVAIIGYNGAGKSTLLSVITGIYPPETGTVKTYGRISPLLSLGAGFDRNYSGRENIFLNGAILGYDKDFLMSKFDEILEFSELEEFIDFPVKNYSSGMLAKLGFSIATIVEPDILIIDEVLGVGDVSFQRKCSDKIRSLMDSGTTVLLVSHSIVQIRNLCEKAIWIDHGVVREIGEVNEVCDHYLEDSKKASREQLKNIKFS